MLAQAPETLSESENFAMAKFDPERDLPAELISAVGLLTIYASQLDVGLVAMLAALTRTPISQADTMLHSTANAKARIDLVLAASLASSIHNDDKKSIAKLLKRAADLNGTRREWIHGLWHRGDGTGKHQVTVFKPILAKPEKVEPLDISSTAQIKKLCTDYHKLTGDLVLLSTRLCHEPPSSE